MTISTSSMSRSTLEYGDIGQLERLVVRVPDPEATATFLSTGFDLRIEPSESGLLAVCHGEYGRDAGQGAIELVAGPELAVEKVVFGLPRDAELRELGSMLEGSEVTDSALTLTEPGGITVTLETRDSLRVPLPPSSTIRPRRMGHINLKSPAPAASAAFFTDVLRLRLSEYIGETLYWMRTDTEHHNVALRPGSRPSVHHVGLEVAGWHGYQPILDNLDAQGYKIEYGPGRHRPGRSLFTYVCDPSSGLRIELFADMAHIADPDAAPIGWEPGDRLSTTLNAWGPLPPQSFLE
ncbi:VOC family protein [Nocardia sp. X0981]